MTGLSVTNQGTSLKQYSYGYDNNRNITSQQDNGTSYSYTYDVLNRIHTSSQFNETYQYDNRDNRSSLTSDRVPALPSAATYQYDSRNRLKNATVDGKSLTYTYNGDGLMVGRTKGSQTTRYYYDDRGLLVAEGNVSGSVVTITYGYVYDAGGKLVGRQSGTEAKLQYYVTNAHGDVVELRDASGSLLNSYSYDLWGNPVTVQETVPNVLRYAGEYWDADTGLQYLRARWYDPSTARFIGEDTYEGQIDNPLSLNLYTYVSNNPLIYRDPTGHIPTAIEAAQMADHIYTLSGTLSGGWKFGYVIKGGDNMRMGVYFRFNSDNTKEYALVNKGTTPNKIEDWINNIQQPFGYSDDMKVSIKEAGRFVKAHSGYEITMVGHSKGGVEAIANAVAARACMQT